MSYDPATGAIGAKVSGQAGNNLVTRPDGSLYVPTGAATVSTGCGLSGNGSGSTPLKVATGTWPYPCSVDSAGGVVACDSNGVLRSEPRGKASLTNYFENRSYNDVPVPTSGLTTVDTYSVTVTNPDTCRPALVLAEQEVDIWLVVPAGGAAATGFDGDEMQYIRNTGSSTMSGIHTQHTKLLGRGTLAAGSSMPVGFGAGVGRGAANAYYYAIYFTLRVLLISL
ncbi:hypothetical protein [Streptomyces griseofuscus]|uniref:Uncharacterized protein n=1 Tax=Streptomyces griseofuscus TaxID=146922 RepID=A0A7H1Q3T6_9ACTN|nr:hypothetical protein [Streptomyces griseofuscus]QNT94966.1 hypothetical protein HEP81_04694 [Streptomyces griseofuscus]